MNDSGDAFFVYGRKEDIVVELFKVIMKQFRTFSCPIMGITDYRYFHVDVGV